MDEILVEFKSETKDLVAQMMNILLSVEDSPEEIAQLENYGQLVDRIMGSAQTLALSSPDLLTVEAIGKYSALCKIVGYKGSQIGADTALAPIVLAFLLDATEQLERMVDRVDVPGVLDQGEFDDTFKDRLSWIAEKFDQNLRASLKIHSTKSPANQADKQNSGANNISSGGVKSGSDESQDPSESVVRQVEQILSGLVKIKKKS